MIDRSQVIRARVIAVIDEIASLMREGQGQVNPLWKPYNHVSINLEAQPPFLELNQDVAYLWDILSALRGPDEQRTNELKTLTTAKIRSTIGIPSNRLVEINSTPLTSAWLPYELTARGSSHFRTHFENAVMALQQLGFIPKEENQNDETNRS